jgi:plastocyanin
MKPFSLILMASAVMLGSVGASFAEPVVVARCNVHDSGLVFKPGLTVIKAGKRVHYGMAENGLTRDIVFSERKALAWARDTLGLGGNAYQLSYNPNCVDQQKLDDLSEEAQREADRDNDVQIVN